MSDSAQGGTPAPVEGGPAGTAPAVEVADLVAGTELQMSALRQLAERSDRRLQSLVDALPGPVVVARGTHVLLANAHAVRRVPGAGAGRLPAPPPPPGGEAGWAALDGGTLRLRAHALLWDARECVLLMGEGAAVSGPPAPAPDGAAPPSPAPGDPDGPAPPAPAARTSHEPLAALSAPAAAVRVRWRPVVDVAADRVAGFVIVTEGGDDGAPGAALQRELVRAVGALAGWPAPRTGPPAVAMVRVPQAAPTGLAAFAEAVLRRAEVPAARLWLRVTAGDDGEELAAARRAGVRVMREDFGGAGGASTAGVDGVALDPGPLRAGEWDVLQGALSVARHLGLATLAPGVDDEATAARLRALGCRWAEGGLYGRPLDTGAAGRAAGRPASTAGG